MQIIYFCLLQHTYISHAHQIKQNTFTQFILLPYLIFCPSKELNMQNSHWHTHVEMDGAVQQCCNRLHHPSPLQPDAGCLPVADQSRGVRSDQTSHRDVTAPLMCGGRCLIGGGCWLEQRSIRRFVIREMLLPMLLPLSHLRHYAKRALTPR